MNYTFDRFGQMNDASEIIHRCVNVPAIADPNELVSAVRQIYQRYKVPNDIIELRLFGIRETQFSDLVRYPGPSPERLPEKCYQRSTEPVLRSAARQLQLLEPTTLAARETFRRFRPFLDRDKRRGRSFDLFGTGTDARSSLASSENGWLNNLPYLKQDLVRLLPADQIQPNGSSDAIRSFAVVRMPKTPRFARTADPNIDGAIRIFSAKHLSDVSDPFVSLRDATILVSSEVGTRFCEGTNCESKSTARALARELPHGQVGTTTLLIARSDNRATAPTYYHQTFGLNPDAFPSLPIGLFANDGEVVLIACGLKRTPTTEKASEDDLMRRTVEQVEKCLLGEIKLED